MNTTYTLDAVDANSGTQGGEVDLKLVDQLDGTTNNIKLKGKGPFIDVSQTIPNQIDFEVFSGSDANFVFTQSVPATTWTITHNLDKFCSVSVVSDGNQLKYGNISYTNSNSLTITFSAAFSGKAYLN